MLFFNVDIDKYYTSLDSNYFIFIALNSSTISNIEWMMWTGLYFAQLSNYTYILPRISCKYCNINNSIWCSYIDCWKIRDLNKCFYNKYRENVSFIFCKI